MYVCMCCAVTNYTVEEAIRRGARSLKDVAQACGAGSGCGGCKATLRKILEDGESTVTTVETAEELRVAGNNGLLPQNPSTV